MLLAASKTPSKGNSLQGETCHGIPIQRRRMGITDAGRRRHVDPVFSLKKRKRLHT
jgi:hypothetical protein